MKPAPDAFQAILVIATRQLGDVLLTTPLIAAVRLRWPAARIDVLGFAGTLGMLRGNGDVTTLVEAPTSGGWRAALGFTRRLWRRYDLALVTQHSDRAHLYGWAAAPVRAGLLPERHGGSWWKARLLAHGVVVAGDRGQVHTAAEKLALLAPWPGTGDGTPDVGAAAVDDAAAKAARSPATRPSVVPPPEKPLPDGLAGELREVFVVVQVPSMWRYKQWPLAHFTHLIGALLAAGVQVVLSGSGTPGDRAKVAAMLPLGPRPQLLDVAGLLDLNQLATLLGRAALYIGPDTSVTHLAAALRVPVIALFGPTNPLRWGPLSEAPSTPHSAPPDTAPAYVRRSLLPQRAGSVILLQGPGDCVPCGRAGCDDHRESRSACLEAITPEAVLAEAQHRLGVVMAAAAVPAGAALPRPPALAGSH